jgi:peptidoglycan hydrolase-like protein with peptidoglycan-binding domain
MVALFEQKAPWIMNLLMRDFPMWGPEDAAACVGNAGHESRGFEDLVEIDKRVGGKGGIGWFQWTGHAPNNPRRRDFEAFCARNRLDRFGDEANYKYLVLELRGSERGTIAAVQNAQGLKNKVVVFEDRFERAGVKHHDRRIAYAQRALAAWKSNRGAAIPPWAGGSQFVPGERPFPGSIISDWPVEEALSMGSSGERVAALQSRLKAIGYDVGAIDGKFGPFTRDALLALQADLGIRPSGIADPVTLQALAIAPPRPISGERRNETLDGLRQKGSTVIDLTDWVKRLAIAFGVVGGAGAITGGSGGLDTMINGIFGTAEDAEAQTADVAMNSADVVTSLATVVQGLLSSGGGIGLLAVGAAVLLWRNSNQIAHRRLYDHQTGANLDK